VRVTQSTDQKVGGSSPSERAQVRVLRCLIGFPVNPHLPPQVSALRWIGHVAEP